MLFYFTSISENLQITLLLTGKGKLQNFKPISWVVSQTFDLEFHSQNSLNVQFMIVGLVFMKLIKWKSVH